MNAAADPLRNRLAWQCRRGMRELDELLRMFLEQGYNDLMPAERKTFEGLLENPDAVLLEWLMGRMIPADMEVAKLVEKIRHTAAA
ncbi:MAG: succinate dehydrogenase assembly factor 2 [Gammaproteobacteria bacterium]|jgi:antitoxin CptB